MKRGKLQHFSVMFNNIQHHNTTKNVPEGGWAVLVETVRSNQEMEAFQIYWFRLSKCEELLISQLEPRYAWLAYSYIRAHGWRELSGCTLFSWF